MFINDESVNAFNLTGSPAIIKTFSFFFKMQQTRLYIKTSNQIYIQPKQIENSIYLLNHLSHLVLVWWE